MGADRGPAGAARRRDSDCAWAGAGSFVGWSSTPALHAKSPMPSWKGAVTRTPVIDAKLAEVAGEVRLVMEWQRHPQDTQSR